MLAESPRYNVDLYAKPGEASRTAKFKFTNRTGQPLTLRAPVISKDEDHEFPFQTNCTDTLDPSATCTVSVTFRPVTSKGMRISELSLCLRDSEECVGQPIFGWIPPPDIEVNAGSKRQFTAIAGTISAPQNFIFTNDVKRNYSVHPVLLGAGAAAFHLDNTTCPTTLTAKARCILTITFRPSAEGTFNAEVSLDVLGYGTYPSLKLTGTATPASAPSK
jgi:hypothetical protein